MGACSVARGETQRAEALAFFACKRAVSRVELRVFELLTTAVQRRRYPSASRWCTVGVLLTGKRPRISRRRFLSVAFFLQNNHCPE